MLIFLHTLHGKQEGLGLLIISLMHCLGNTLKGRWVCLSPLNALLSPVLSIDWKVPGCSVSDRERKSVCVRARVCVCVCVCHEAWQVRYTCLRAGNNVVNVNNFPSINLALLCTLGERVYFANLTRGLQDCQDSKCFYLRINHCQVCELSSFLWEHNVVIWST